MMTYCGVAATDPTYDLAEGVLWDDRASRVRWVDILAGSVLSGELSGDRIVDIDEVVLGQTAGAVALAEDGGLLVAAARGLATISVIGALSFGPDLLGGRGDVRLNDGSVDPQGRFLVGSLSLGAETGTEVLLRVSSDGTVETIRAGIRLSNGVAFSPSGDTIYHVDTLARSISSHSYGPAEFDDDEPWIPVPLDLPEYPDGLAVDLHGNLWVAVWGGASVRGYSPTGELLDLVSLNARQVSCPAFVGPALDVLAITTAREGLQDISDDSGAIFTADIGTTGLPAFRWAGSTTHPYWLSPEREVRRA